MKRQGRSLLLLAVLILLPNWELNSATPRHQVRIPLSCLTKDVILTGCDVRGSVPSGCKHAIVTYKSDCFIIEN